MIHPEALKRAQEKAELTIGRDNYDRALLAAYLSDPAVHEAAHTALVRDMFTDDEDGYARIVLQAIGAEVSP